MKRKRKSRASPSRPFDHEEVFGPFPPPGGKFVDGRLVPIPPSQSRTAEEDRARVAAVSAQVVPASVFDLEPWLHAGGACGFSIDGQAPAMPVSQFFLKADGTIGECANPTALGKHISEV